MQEKRVITNEDVKKYDALINKYLRDNISKNWKEATMNPSTWNQALGNTGMTMEDMRQYLRQEVCVAIQNYDPSKGTKESTFVYTHLFNRCGQLMKKLTRKSSGYGFWGIDINFDATEE